MNFHTFNFFPENQFEQKQKVVCSCIETLNSICLFMLSIHLCKYLYALCTDLLLQVTAQVFDVVLPYHGGP